jgi:hypothetical protein
MEGQETKRATRGEQHTTACKRPTTTIEREDTQWQVAAESEKESCRKEGSGVPRKWQAGKRTAAHEKHAQARDKE